MDLRQRALALALERSGRPKQPSSGGYIGLALALLVGAAALSGITFGVFPGTARVLAPALCPSDTSASQVVLDITRSGSKTSYTPHLVCTRTSGRMVRIGPGRLFLGQVGAWWIALGAMTVVGRLRKRGTS